MHSVFFSSSTNKSPRYSYGRVSEFGDKPAQDDCPDIKCRDSAHVGHFVLGLDTVFFWGLQSVKQKLERLVV
jgi:hypothetical protein